jgi:pimeloyl-ACP methyl ester carboxylesterase
MIPGAELVRFTDAGHYVHEEQPEGVAHAIEAWIQQHDLAAPALPRQ